MVLKLLTSFFLLQSFFIAPYFLHGTLLIHKSIKLLLFDLKCRRFQFSYSSLGERTRNLLFIKISVIFNSNLHDCIYQKIIINNGSVSSWMDSNICFYKGEFEWASFCSMLNGKFWRVETARGGKGFNISLKRKQ